MGALLIFAFLSGLVTIFAPCIWPLLPLILSTTVTGGHRKPFGVVLGIALSFGILTLALGYIIKIFPFDANLLRLFSVFLIGFLGLTLLIPKLAQTVEGYVSRMSGTVAQKFIGKNTNGFWGGLIIGLALGIVWAPCAGPILATIATLAATHSVNLGIILVTASYVTGIAIPLLIFAILGRRIFTKTRALSKYTGTIQQIFGIIMIITAILIFTNYDKKIEASLLNKFPAFSSSLNAFEGNSKVSDELSKLKGSSLPNAQTSNENDLLNVNYKAPEFSGITNWINLPDGKQKLSISELKGKVVLVDFWTYTCINCIRTLPFTTSWDKKYKDQGLVIIGVHTPEFEFEKDTKNVENAMKQYGINYIVAQDNDYGTWNAYNNQYWPAEYLIDANGNVRRTHFGEGEYDKTEMAIQQLLKEAGKNVNTKINTNNPSLNSNISPETYIGSNRMEYFYPNGRIFAGENNYNLQTNFPTNSFTLGGKWNIMGEYSEAVSKGELAYNFQAQHVYLVMRPKDGKPHKVKIFLDGKSPQQFAGKDVVNGEVTVDSDRLYDLINLPDVENKILKLQFDDGVEVFAFTFG